MKFEKNPLFQNKFCGFYSGQDFADSDRCKKCDGKQVTREKKIQEIAIDKGRKHNDKITLRGAGDQKVRFLHNCLSEVFCMAFLKYCMKERCF